MQKIFLIKDDKIGEGELGGMMMGGFLQAISLQDQAMLPQSIILLNRGVLLGTKNEQIQNEVALQSLQKLEEMGVEILFCQTCIDFFGLKEKNVVGKIDNAMHITQLILSNEVVSL